jgi:hypothetical protein
VESHAASAPAGNVSEESSATLAYCPETSCTPKPTPGRRKIQPMMFVGRRETISAPRVAKVGLIRAIVSQNS